MELLIFMSMILIPIGLIYIWFYQEFLIGVRVIVSILMAFVFLYLLFNIVTAQKETIEEVDTREVMKAETPEESSEALRKAQEDIAKSQAKIVEELAKRESGAGTVRKFEGSQTGATFKGTQSGVSSGSAGETIRFGDLKLTFNSSRTSNGMDYFRPEEDQYVIVDMTIENLGSEEANISSLLHFTLKDAESYAYTDAIFVDTKGTLNGSIAPGDRLRGEIGFDVPKSAYYELVFESLWRDGQAIWKFTP